jgi:post-segregation antitoxin (ccd killing protein)
VNGGVYHVCMSRVNIYLPDDLASRAREAGLNVSGLAQEALEQALNVHDFAAWLAAVRTDPPLKGATHAETIAALDSVREEAGDVFPPGYDVGSR